MRDGEGAGVVHSEGDGDDGRSVNLSGESRSKVDSNWNVIT